MDEVSRLKSVNWTTGMLLSPSHFRRQDAFLEETVGWLLQYCIPGMGLVGAGIRIAPGERGLARFDPRVDVRDDGESISIAVLEARGLTALGQMVEVNRSNPVRTTIRRSELAGLTDAQIYLVHEGGREDDPTSIGVDDANPTQAAYRRSRLTVQIGADADLLPQALCVARIRRVAESMQFDLDPQFIPACATMLGHSQLYADWKRLHADVVALSAQFAELHRQCSTYIGLLGQRGADVAHDRDILSFIERAVLALDHAAYETFDPTITPDQGFREIERIGRRVALALDLSESSRLYFDELGQADATYTALLEEERDALTRPREFGVREDLQTAIKKSDATLSRLHRLGDALEARYIDFRLSRSIEALRFLIDAEGEQFFLSVATPGHPQRDLDMLTFVFAQLNLATRQRYRLVFLADPLTPPWQVGETFRVDIRLNPGSFDGRPLSSDPPCSLPGQRNFAVDFEPDPSMPSLAALQVTVQPGVRIRGCILYQRRLGMGGRAQAIASTATADPRPAVRAPAPALAPSAPPAVPPAADPPASPRPKVTLRRSDKS